MPLRPALLALCVVLIWGVNFVAIHYGLQDVPPILFAAIRFTVILPALFFVPRPAVPWPRLATVGLLMSAGQFGLLYSAMAAGLPAGLASLVLQAQVLFTVLFAALALREHPSRRQLTGVVIGAIGLLVVAAGRQASTPLLALLLSIAAASSWAAGNIAARRLGPVSGLGVTVWGSTVVPVPLFLLSLLTEGPARIADALAYFSTAAVLSTLYTSVLSTLVAYTIWNSLLGRYPAAAVAPFTLLVPVIGITTAWLVLGERPNHWEATGGLVLLAGVAVAAINPAAFRRRRRDRPPGVG